MYCLYIYIFFFFFNIKAVVTGYFNFDSVKPNGFYSFYLASLRNLEYDAHESIAFAIVTNPRAANRLGINLITTSQQFDVRLHLWNETLVGRYTYL